MVFYEPFSFTMLTLEGCSGPERDWFSIMFTLGGYGVLILDKFYFGRMWWS